MIQVYFACLQDTWGLHVLYFFFGLKNKISGKIFHHVSQITIGYPRKIYEGILFFIMCHHSLDVSGQPLLSAILCKNQTKWEMKNFDPPLKFACK